MNEEEKDKLFSNIESDLWELKHNVAYINKKDYYGLSRDLLDYIRKIEKENKQLQNNWNELKKWLGTRINTDKDYKRNSHIKEKLQVEDYVIKQVMFFMQELEGNNE